MPVMLVWLLTITVFIHMLFTFSSIALQFLLVLQAFVAYCLLSSSLSVCLFSLICLFTLYYPFSQFHLLCLFNSLLLYLLCASSPLHVAAVQSQWNPTWPALYRLRYWVALSSLFKSSVQICHDGLLSNSTSDPQCCHTSIQYAAFHIQRVETLESLASVCSTNFELSV